MSAVDNESTMVVSLESCFARFAPESTVDNEGTMVVSLESCFARFAPESLGGIEWWSAMVGKGEPGFLD